MISGPKLSGLCSSDVYMKPYYLFLYFIATIISCTERVDTTGIFFGQGIMSGEISESAAILQTRFTAGDSLIDGDLPGTPGLGYFEISQSIDFTEIKSFDVTSAESGDDYIIKQEVNALLPGTTYYYRIRFAKEGKNLKSFGIGPAGKFKTLGGEFSTDPISLVVVTGMNHYHFHYGKYESAKAYTGADKSLGFPALETILQFEPNYFIGTGDNVYYDHPARGGFDKAVAAEKNPHPGGYDGRAVSNLSEMRKKFHEQFSQPRFVKLFANIATYWMKDDHDYRYNDSDPYSKMPISHELGIATFIEQLPFPEQVPYRTHRLNRDLQIWFVEGRDFRSSNDMAVGPDKTIWGEIQKNWLQETLLASDATFKLLISPTPMVGPDDAYKKDNHTNPDGFKHEGDDFFAWLTKHEFQNKNFFIVCGDRHWQYHAKHPSGIEEFSTGALVDNNSRAGRVSGDPSSTDPYSEIEQFFIQGRPEQATGGFLNITVNANDENPEARFIFCDEHGNINYQATKSTLRNE